jgi:hypothetical protein
VLQLVEALGIDGLVGGRGLVVVLEAREDGLAVVDEVEHEGLFLAGVGTVQSGQGLHRLDAGEALVHVHGAEQRLVEAGLVLVGDDEHLVGIGRELGRQLRLLDGLPLGWVFICGSVYLTPGTASSSTSPEKATRQRTSA